MPEPNPIVFLLDDEQAVVVALARMLQSSGFTVRPYTSAAEFLETHDAEAPGCLVADVRMPDMSGLELQRTLAKRGIDRAIVFVTGHEALLREAIGRAQHREREDLVRRLASLTPRERQVLELVATGMLNKQIAAELGAAEKTIKVHRGRIMEKMQVRTATALVGLLSRAETRADPARGSPAA